MLSTGGIQYRYNLEVEDLPWMKIALESVGVFSDEEKTTAIDMALETLRRISDYNYIVAIEDNLVGFICYGRIPFTLSSYDIYWVVVNKEDHRLGIGSSLIARAEEVILSKGGERVFVETSSRYNEAINFYLKNGYRIIHLIENFYKKGDHKITFRKFL